THGDLRADVVVRDRVRAHLDQVPTRGDLSCLEVTGYRLGDLAWIDLAVAELYRAVAVLVLCADSGDNARPGLDNGDRDDPVVRVEDLSHAELLAQNAFAIFRHCSRALRLSGSSLLDVHVDAGRKVDTHQRIDRFRRRFE